MKEMKGVQALAMLPLENIDNREEELHLLIEDAAGRCVVRRRFSFLLGVGEQT